MMENTVFTPFSAPNTQNLLQIEGTIIMMDYDSSDHFECSISSVVESNSNGGLPNNTGQIDDNTLNSLQPAPEQVEQQHASCAIIRKNQRPTDAAVPSLQSSTTATTASSTRKRCHPPCQHDDDDDNDERTKHSAKATTTAEAEAAAETEASEAAEAAETAETAETEPSLESSNATDRDNQDEETNETNQTNNNNNNKKQTIQIIPRPSSSSSSSCCRKCGRFDFTTATGARRHEGACDGTKNPKGPWKCPTCGRDSFLTSQAFGGHYRCCNKVRQAGGVVTPTLYSLGRPRGTSHDDGDDDDDGRSASPLEVARLKLSNFNQLVLECIELFEASQADVDVQVTGNGKRHIAIVNVGIRCVHCARHDTLPIGSISYTSDLKTLPHAIYVMVQRHLLVTCAHINDEMKRQLRETKKNSTSQSCTKGNIGLPAYLRLLAEIYGLTDDGKKLGVRRIASTITTAVTTEALAAAAAVREGEICPPHVATPSERGASATTDIQNGNQSPNHSNSIEDEPATSLEMEHHHQLPSGETGPNNHQDYYNQHFSSFLEEVTEEVEI